MAVKRPDAELTGGSATKSTTGSPSLPAPGAAGRSALEGGAKPTGGTATTQPVAPATQTQGTVKPGTRTPSDPAASTTPATPSTPVTQRGQQYVDQLLQQQDAYEKTKPGRPGGTYGGTGGGSGSGGTGGGSGSGGSGSGDGSGGSGSGDGSGKTDTPVAGVADYYTQAGETTQRITQGMDLTDKIEEADAAMQGATEGYKTAAEGILAQLQGVTEQDLAAYAESTGQTIEEATRQINDIIAGMQEKLQPVDASRVGRVDTAEEENLLQQIVDAQRQQSENQINYAVEQGVNDLTRAEEDAQAQFQTQRDQIAANERQALDNSALYSEMRGDRGGVGQAQYNSIQNTAATNQLTVNKEQTKLATDTARQIADLRAKGEFQKADELLSITQSYLSQLMQLKQWADETNVSIDEFNIGVEQWEQEYNAKIQQALGELGINAVEYQTGLNLSRDQDLQSQKQRLNDTLAQYGLQTEQATTQQELARITDILSAYQKQADAMASTELAAAQLTGAFSDATPTQQARAQADAKLAAAGEAMLQAGLTPSDDQLAAMGWSKEQYKAYKKAADEAKKRRGSGSSMKLLALMRDMVELGKPLAVIEEQLDYAVRSGNYGSADSQASTDFISEQKRTGYKGKPE